MSTCAGECLFLCIGIYLCYCIRSAPSFYFENKFISFAVFNELLISTVYYVVRYLSLPLDTAPLRKVAYAGYKDDILIGILSALLTY